MHNTWCAARAGRVIRFIINLVAGPCGNHGNVNGNAFLTDETNEDNNKSISINIPLDKLRADVHTSQDDRRVFRP